jgi:hypothetical protein
VRCPLIWFVMGMGGWGDGRRVEGGGSNWDLMTKRGSGMGWDDDYGGLFGCCSDDLHAGT